jgi:hypothetical protein
MPEVMCPKCGLTINLENRREIDHEMIMDATRKSATFTELLRATKLSRKTLSLRLKELCSRGTLVKGNGVYTLHESFRESRRDSENQGRNFSFSRAFHDRRVRTLVCVLMLATSFSVSGYVLAMYMAPSQNQATVPVARVLGSFRMTLDVHGVEGLYAWEAVIHYDPAKLKVLSVEPGDFLGVGGFPLFVYETDLYSNAVLLASTLVGDMPPKSGNGTLATITFEYFDSNYELPNLVPQIYQQETSWINSQGIEVPFEIGTVLTLTMVGAGHS